METSELSLIRYHTLCFFSIIINAKPFQPVSTILIKIVEALISSESEPDTKVKARVNWIYEHTHSQVDKPLSIVELAVFKNLAGSLNKEIEIGQKTFSLIMLYKYLDEVSKELTQIVISIAKKYNVEMPMINMVAGSSGNIQNITI